MYRTIMFLTPGHTDEITEVVQALRRACSECITVVSYEIGFDPDVDDGQVCVCAIIDFASKADADLWPYTKQYLNMVAEMPHCLTESFSYQRED